MKRILFIYHVSNIGGGSYCLLNLLKELDRTLFCPLVLLPHPGPLCDEIKMLNIEVIYYPTLTLYPYNQSLVSFKVLRRIIKMHHCKLGFKEILLRINPDIVYFNTMMLFPFLRIAKKCRCKTVLHVREHWPLEEHKHQLNYARKIVYRYADSLVCINRYSANIFPNKKSVIVHDWIDMNERRGGPRLSDILGVIAPNCKSYLFTGGIDPMKGTYEVINVFTNSITGNDRRLIAMGIDTKMEFIGFKGCIKKLMSIIGYKTYKEKVINLCSHDSRIICIPSVYNITDLMEDIDVFISFFTKPHANLALAESIILKKVSIAAETDESLEYSLEGDLAELFKLGDIEAFKQLWMKIDETRSPKGDILSEQSVLIAKKFDKYNNASKFNTLLAQMF